MMATTEPSLPAVPVDTIRLPVAGPLQACATPLVERLATAHGASWLDEDSLDAWSREPGDRVVLFAGDPVRFPEGQDVAVVLPELRRSVPGGFAIGILPRHLEERVAQRWGVQRWPSLLFLRGGRHVGIVAGMLDWDVYLQEVTRVLGLPASRVPGIGIPVVSAAGPGASCR